MSAATAASTLSKDAPSHFAALLRRSKFASYDQQVAQVYTSYGGFAHRGDWGLKRSLPQKVRTRRPLITVTAVDSIFQQTEWSRTGTSTRFLERWNEMGMDQLRSDSGHVGLGWNDTRSTKLLDSDFARAPGSDDLSLPGDNLGTTMSSRGNLAEARQIPVQNVDKMSPREFERYLAKLRALRPKFRAFLQAKADKKMRDSFNIHGSALKPRVKLDLTQLSLDPIYESAPEDFIAREVSLSAGRGAWIEQRPHPTGALTYTQSSPLQSHLFFSPVIGRLVDTQGSVINTDGQMSGGVFVAAVAGVTSIVDGQTPDAGQRGMDYGPYSRPDDDPDKWKRRDPKSGVVPLRITSAHLARSPRVVGERAEDIVKGARLESIRSEVFNPHQIQNEHRPGTPAWVTVRAKGAAIFVERTKPVTMTVVLPKDTVPTYRNGYTTNVLSALGNMIQHHPPHSRVPDEDDDA